MKSKLTFAVCAYGDSPLLEDAVKSALNQTERPEIVIATSTPSEFISGVAAKYGVRLAVNPEKQGIAADWNFALSCAETPYALIAHQDDVYFPEYAARVSAALDRHPEAAIVFTDYCDLLSDGRFHSRRLYLVIKRLLLWPFYLKEAYSSLFFKRLALRFGNPICCPSVTYRLEKLGDRRFDRSYSVNLDWAMWLALASIPGAGFVYVAENLMAHRIADAMETAAAISDRRRYNEDFAIFEKLWGKTIAGLLMKGYQLSYRANTGK